MTGRGADAHEAIYRILTSDDEGRVCRDIPEQACVEQPRSFTLHLLALTATKAGDGLADPKLVLAWLLGAMGAPAAASGLLVPVREAFALLPQLVVAAAIRRRPRRKWAWVAGSVVQGLAMLAIAAMAGFADGPLAGWAIVGLVAVFACARSVCSISHKDVLGKTIAKSRRGTVTGTAGTLSALIVLAFSVLLAFDLIPLQRPVIASAVCCAGLLWLVAAALFARIPELAGATEGGGNALDVACRHFAMLRDDVQLRRFILARALLVSTALAPPYYLAIAGEQGGHALGALGPFMIASAAAGVFSTYAWGRGSDVSSRRVLIVAALLAALANGGLGVFHAWRAAAAAPVGTPAWLAPAMLFVLVTAHQGVRLGRSTHVIDMAGPDTRAAYTALGNTIIGAVLLVGGVFGWIAQSFGPEVVLQIFGLMGVAAALVAWRLDEVQ